MRENVIGDDALAIALWERHRRGCSRRLFIEHRTELRFSNYLFKDGEFSAVKMLLLLLGISCRWHRFSGSSDDGQFMQPNKPLRLLPANDTGTVN